MFHYTNGDVYDGSFVKNKRIGNCRLIFADKSEYIGQFIDDEADGNGIYTDKVGNRYMSISKPNDKQSNSEEEPEMNGHFLRGRLYGKGEIHFKNTDYYIGQFKGSKRHGKGKMIYNQPNSEVDFSNVGTYQGNWSKE